MDNHQPQLWSSVLSVAFISASMNTFLYCYLHVVAMRIYTLNNCCDVSSCNEGRAISYEKESQPTYLCQQGHNTLNTKHIFMVSWTHIF